MWPCLSLPTLGTLLSTCCHVRSNYFVNPLHCRPPTTGTLPCLMQSRQSCLLQVVVVSSRIRTENWLLAVLRHLLVAVHPSSTRAVRSPLKERSVGGGRTPLPAHTPCRPHPLFFFASFLRLGSFILSPWSYPPLLGPSRQAGKQTARLWLLPQTLSGLLAPLGCGQGSGGTMPSRPPRAKPLVAQWVPSSHAHLNHGPWALVVSGLSWVRQAWSGGNDAWLGTGHARWRGSATVSYGVLV